MAVLSLTIGYFLGSEAGKDSAYNLRAAFEPPHINISRSDYDAALAKWRSHNISEYEISVRVDAGWDGHVATYRISDHGSRVRQTDPVLEIAPSAENFEQYKKDTIEGIFEKIDRLLSKGELYYYGRDYLVAHNVVDFDPDLGYPTYLQSNAYCVDCGGSWRVTQFAIIRADAPSSPR